MSMTEIGRLIQGWMIIRRDARWRSAVPVQESGPPKRAKPGPAALPGTGRAHRGSALSTRRISLRLAGLRPVDPDATLEGR